MWQCKKITTGTENKLYHWISYYDLPIWSDDGRFLVVQQVKFQGTKPTSEDILGIGIIDLEDNNRLTMIGESRAWSWQQGAMAQWITGKSKVIWNNLENKCFISNVYDVEKSRKTTLPYPVYIVSPKGDIALTLNFSRLNDMRPGYGYSQGSGDQNFAINMPDDDGVWSFDLETSKRRLVLSLKDAAVYAFRDYVYFLKSYFVSFKHLRSLNDLRFWRLFKLPKFWFNHIKINPDGSRFTVKCRYKIALAQERLFTVSLTCNIAGNDCRFLADETSHVMWRNSRNIYLWRNGLFLYEDAPPTGRPLYRIGEGIILKDAHVRYLGKDLSKLIYDVPYRETIPLYCYEEKTGANHLLAKFMNHIPAKGEFRCDLHPCPSPDGKKIVVNSLQDGGRQIYLLEYK